MSSYPLWPGFGPLLLAALPCLAGAAQAEGLRFSVGLYAGATTSPFEDDKTEAAAMPDFLIEGERFSFGTSGLTYDLLETSGFALSARLAPRFFAADPTKVPGLEHMKRDIAVEAGLAARLSLGQIELGIEALKDVSDTHDGAAVTASVGTMFQLSDRLGIGARVGATWMDRKLATYSYGVLPSEAGGGLSAYDVGEAVIPSIGIEASFALTDKTTLIGGMTAEFLPDSVTASPIVKRDTLVSAMIGLRYAF
jgi:outer membrane scaffolding protein for murein synthesis (MipA/OmpV family)